MLGSGATRVSSLPAISTTPTRFRAESKLNVACATAPSRNLYSAVTYDGTVTSNDSPARGPLPITRVGPAEEPSAATRAIGPNTWVSAVR